MAVSVKNSELIYKSLKKCGVKIVSALPETWLVHLIRFSEEDPDMQLVRLAKEEEGVGISAGAHFAGLKSAMLMQNHGFSVLYIILASLVGTLATSEQVYTLETRSTGYLAAFLQSDFDSFASYSRTASSEAAKIRKISILRP